MADVLPRNFGKYLLERRLGVGGMAETFVARREGAGGIEQHVCLKRVLPAFNSDKSFRDQFQREARLAARLRHSNIVGTIDYGSVEGVQYMALELVEGLDLRALISAQPDKRLSEAHVVLVAFDIAHALEYAHEARQDDEGIVHRDVTPSNVLLSIRGEVKLADFGVAKALGTATAMTATGVMKGKMPYMPPEQMKGGVIDGRVDLFSVGVLMYEALAGRRPFVGAHDVEVMSRIITDDRPTLAELAPGITPGLAEVVEALLAIEADERVASAAALIDLLTPFVPPPAARDSFSKLIRAAYGDERHEGAASDTVLAEASALPVAGATPGADAYASTATAPPITQAAGRRAAPTILQMDSPMSSPETSAAPMLGATLVGPASLPANGNDDKDTLDERPNILPGTMSLAPVELRDTRDDKPARARAVPTVRHRREANDGRSRRVAVVFFVGLLAAGGAFFLLGDNAEPSVAAVLPGDSATSAGELEREDGLERPAELDPLPDGAEVPAPGADSERPDSLDSTRTSPSSDAVALNEPADLHGSTTMQAMSARPPASAALQRGISEPSERAAPGGERSDAVNAETETESAAEMETRRRARISVRVTVAPWGFVWIDGNFMGRSPVDAELPPGRHRIGAGQDDDSGPVMHRNVNVSSQRRRRLPVHFDLEPMLSME